MVTFTLFYVPKNEGGRMVPTKNKSNFWYVYVYMPSPENSPALLGRGSARWAQFSKHSEAPFDSQVTILPLLYNRGGGVALRSGHFRSGHFPPRHLLLLFTWKPRFLPLLHFFPVTLVIKTHIELIGFSSYNSEEVTHLPVSNLG